MTQLTLKVDSRKRDPKSEMVVKYTNMKGVPTDFKPIRTITPNTEKLTELARFIVKNLDGKYVGGFNHNGNDVIVEGPEGSHPLAGGKKGSGSMYPATARVSTSFLWPVFEPYDDETEYVNKVAEKCAALAGNGGRIRIKNEIFE